MNSADSNKRQKIAAQLTKDLLSQNDLSFLNLVISKLEHMAWPRREEQQMLSIHVQRAIDIIASMNSKGALRAINRKIADDAERADAKSDQHWYSNCLDRYINDRIDEIDFASKVKSEDDLINLIEEKLRNKQYGVSSDTLDLVKRLESTDAILRFAYEDIGNDVARSHIESYLEDIAYERQDVNLLEEIAKRTPRKDVRERARSRISNLRQG
jgi:hypothetical protein